MEKHCPKKLLDQVRARPECIPSRLRTSPRLCPKTSSHFVRLFCGQSLGVVFGQLLIGAGARSEAIQDVGHCRPVGPKNRGHARRACPCAEWREYIGHDRAWILPGWILQIGGRLLSTADCPRWTR